MLGGAYLAAGRSVAAAALALCLALTAAVPVSAQGRGLNQVTRSYITPFPTGDAYNLVVFGDSLGDGIWAGLYRVLKEEENIEVVKHSRVSTGFSRPEYYDWNAALDEILKNETVHIAVIMVGANDLQAIQVNRKWYRPGTEQWRDAYGARVDGFIKRLKEARAAVYWVGLPIMRSDDFNRGMQVMNEIFREKAFLNGVRFIDTWNGFADEFGRYSAYGPDLSGQMRRLRAEDGVHFTMSGYVKLAHFVEREIRRDLRVARAERDIPLAGSEEEQARIIRRGSSGAVFSNLGSGSSVASRLDFDRSGDNEPPSEPEVDAGPTASAAIASSSETAALRATITRAAETTIPNIALVRPPLAEGIAASVPANYAPPGETISHQMVNGVTALATISPMNDPNLAGPHQLPLAERPYYRVLVRGDQLDPKIGRADDFAWPHATN